MLSAIRTRRCNSALLAIFTLVCSALCPLPSLAARPTHSLSREPAHRLIVPAHSSDRLHGLARSDRHPGSAVYGSHSSAGNQAGRAHASSRKNSNPTARPSARKHLQTSFNVADVSTLRRVHAWRQSQRDLAGHAAIASADRSTPNAHSHDPDALDGDEAAVPAALVNTVPELPAIHSIAQDAVTPTLLPSLYDARGHLLMPSPLYGSHEVLLHQNQMADHDGLIRVRDDADLLDLRRNGKLSPLPASEALVVDERLPENRRFARPWTAQFLAVLARDFYASFHEPIQVNSAVRTVRFQQRLVHTNGNAAPAAGETASPHLTGQAVDIGKRGLTLTQLAWMRIYLQPLITQGSIDVEEEFQQSCFHISVYRSYVPPAPLHLNLAASQAADPAPTY